MFEDREFIRIEETSDGLALVERGCGCCETHVYLDVLELGEKLQALNKFLEWILEQLELVVKAVEEEG
ncbi:MULTISPECIES: hypothetical protein [unclassified Archaeoglobus]|jgi:hypothetical protein|uniref:hypothetical protein n=1 Tax=unclassified Archaeoglobus TaxID=2643606 RepID=UPI0025BA00C3|nr:MULTISPECIES: hypothetical protein [unclassified Archaeoglobus]